MSGTKKKTSQQGWRSFLRKGGPLIIFLLFSAVLPAAAGPTVKSVEVLQPPRLNYYAGFDTVENILYSGACVQVTYEDDTVAVLNNSADNFYTNQGGLSVTYDLEDSEGGWKEGTFALTLSLDACGWSQEYEAQILPETEIPELTEDTVWSTGLSLGEWFRFTAPRAGCYLFSVKTSAYFYRYLYGYDPEGNRLNPVVGSNYTIYRRGKDGCIFYLEENETCLIQTGMNSSDQQTNIQDNQAVISVEAASEGLSEDFLTGDGIAYFRMVPEETAPYAFDIGFQDFSYNFEDPIIIDSEGNRKSLIGGGISAGVFPEEYRFAVFHYDSDFLDNGEEYILIWPVSGTWALRMRNTSSDAETDRLSLNSGSEGNIASGNKKTFLYTVEEEGFYHFRMTDMASLKCSCKTSDNFEVIYTNSHSESDPDGIEHLYNDRVMKLSAGSLIQVCIENLNDEDQAYQLSFEKLPDIREMSVSGQPDPLKFSSSDSLGPEDLNGLELAVFYTDGTEERIRFDGDAPISGRTGIAPVIYRISKSEGTLPAGSFSIKIYYLDQSVLIQ